MAKPRNAHDAAEAIEIIENYFEKCAQDNEPPLLSGLALVLGMTRLALSDYEEHDFLGELIVDARIRIEQDREKAARLGQSDGASMRFLLERGHGWGEKRTIRNEMAGGLAVRWQDPARDGAPAQDVAALVPSPPTEPDED